jgi:phosphatidylinositol alpha-mannosyltransferase
MPSSGRTLRIGMVSPYGWDVPGGVQVHIKDLAETLIAQGHSVSVLAPVSQEEHVLEEYVVSAGRPIPIPYNGAVARILFGPLASSRVKQWIGQGAFDVIHIHEPAIPSLSLLTAWAAEGPIVATFHAAANKQKAIYAVGPILEAMLEKVSAKIAVSEMARTTLKDHFDTEAVVIPNGIDSKRFAQAVARSEWESDFTIGFLGRFDEPRKGLSLLIEAFTQALRTQPDMRLLIAGPGEEREMMKKIPTQVLSNITFLGRLDDESKAQFFKSLDLYVAPNTGGESFGIILAEAMSAGTPILASDIPAFAQLLKQGECGALFHSEEIESLAAELLALVNDPQRRSLLSAAGTERAKDFDWGTVSSQIMDVYEMVIAGNSQVVLAAENRGWNRLRNNG